MDDLQHNICYKLAVQIIVLVGYNVLTLQAINSTNLWLLVVNISHATNSTNYNTYSRHIPLLIKLTTSCSWSTEAIV